MHYVQVCVWKSVFAGSSLHYFDIKKTSAESHHVLVDVYSEHAQPKLMCQKWLERLKSGDFVLKDKERSGRTNKFEYE